MVLVATLLGMWVARFRRWSMRLCGGQDSYTVANLTALMVAVALFRPLSVLLFMHW